MTATMGEQLGVAGSVSGSYDVPKNTGYGVRQEITLDGTRSEEDVLISVLKTIKEAGDIPIWVSVTLTWAGHEWPWTRVVSKFDIEYMAAHTAEGSAIAGLAALIWTLTPLVAEFLWILLQVGVAYYVVLKADDFADWWVEHGPDPAAIGAGIGAGAVALLALMVLTGENKK